MKKLIILSLLSIFIVANAATTTLTLNPQKITVSGTAENDLNFDNILSGIAYDVTYGNALIEWISGTSVQFNCNGTSITSESAAINSTQTKLILPLKRGINIRFKGSAGGEVFNVTIVRQ